MHKWIQQNSTTKDPKGLAATLRLVADLLDGLDGTHDFHLPGVLQALKDDVEKIFKRHEKMLEGEPEGLDTEPSPTDNTLHGET